MQRGSVVDCRLSAQTQDLQSGEVGAAVKGSIHRWHRTGWLRGSDPFDAVFEHVQEMQRAEFMADQVEATGSEFARAGVAVPLGWPK